MGRAWDDEGTIYFLKLEPRDGIVLPYYKMGFTGYREGAVQERIAGLQTGNPFKIVAHHEIRSEFAGGLEAYVHKKYRKYMVGQDDPTWNREWFKFDSIDQLSEAYKDAARQNAEYEDTALKLKELCTKPSSGNYVELPEKGRKLLEEWKALHVQQHPSTRLQEQINLQLEISGRIGVLLQTAKDDGTDVSDTSKTSKPRPFKPKEDWEATAEQNPQEWQDCYKDKIKFAKRANIFKEYKPSIDKVCPPTEEVSNLKKIKRALNKPDFPATEYKDYVLSTDKLYELKEIVEVRGRHLSHVDSDKKFIEVQLQVILGQNDGFYVMCESDAQKELASKPSTPTRTVGGAVALDVFSWPRTQVYDAKATQREFKRQFGSKIVWTTPDEPTPASEESLPE